MLCNININMSLMTIGRLLQLLQFRSHYSTKISEMFPDKVIQEM